MFGDRLFWNAIAASVTFAIASCLPSAHASQTADGYFCASPVLGVEPALNLAVEPVMRDLVRDSTWIALARVEAVEPLTEDERALHRDGPDITRRRGNTHRYHFSLVETLKGEASDQFTLLGGLPIALEERVPCPPQRILNMSRVRSCQAHNGAQVLREEAFAIADSGRGRWSRFYYINPDLARSGMGTAIEGGPRLTCGERVRLAEPATSFEVGQTFLILHDGEGEFQMPDPNGLNYALITREDDAWLAAVRHFVSKPQEDHLPPVSLGDVIGLWGMPQIIAPRECEWLNEWELEAYSHPVRLMNRDEFNGDRTAWRFHTSSSNGEEVRWRCDRGARFLAFTDFGRELEWPGHRRNFMYLPIFPIILGEVDFSGMPGPWTFAEGERIDLDTVMELAEAAERD